MKKIFVLALIMASFTASAQIKNYFFADTTAANTSPTRMYRTPGAQIVTRDGGQKFWIRNFTRTAWVLMGDGSGSGGAGGITQDQLDSMSASIHNTISDLTWQNVLNNGNESSGGIIINGSEGIGLKSPSDLTSQFIRNSGVGPLQEIYRLPYNGGAGGTLCIFESGTYTPTAAGVLNVSNTNTTGLDSRYIRVGDQVFVSGQVSITPTATNTSTVITLTLPIASAVRGGTSTDVFGVAVCDAMNDGSAGRVVSGSGVAQVTCKPSASGANVYLFSFNYIIK